MKKFCEECGSKLDPGVEFCEECGSKVSEPALDMKNNEDVNEYYNSNITNRYKNKHKTITIISLCIVIIIAFSGIGYFIVYPNLTHYMEEKKNQEKADKVINEIKQLNIKTVSLESENDLNKISSDYNSLSSIQKKLVTNYNKLEKAYIVLQSLKDTEAAQIIIDKIDKIDASTLTDSDTSIVAIREEYSKLTDAQKKLVTNENELIKFEATVQAKRDEQAQTQVQLEEAEGKKASVMSLIKNFIGFSGVWGDFGAHNSSEQGMLEQAIKSQIHVSDYFDGDPNMVTFEIYPFQWDGTNAFNGTFFLKFEGLNPTGGRYLTIEGGINVTSSWDLEFVESRYY